MTKQPIQGGSVGAERGLRGAPQVAETAFDPKKGIPGKDGRLLDPRNVDLITEITQPLEVARQLRPETIGKILSMSPRPLFRDW